MKWGVIILSAAAFMVGANALAQEEVLRGETVLGRPRPDYDPLGLRVGGFLFYPELSAQESYDSNIFATEHDPKSDFITWVEPKLALKSDWNNHALNFHADSRIARYADHDTEDYENYSFGTDGKLDIQHDARLLGAAGYGVQHEPRYSPNDLGGVEPTKYDDLYGNVAGEKEFNRLALRLDGSYDRYRYTDVRNALGQTLDESGRDYDQKQIGLRTGYELAPLRQIYARGTYNWRDYVSNSDIFGLNRNSTGYSAVVGTQYDLTGITFVDVFVGYREQDYQDVRLPVLRGPTAGAKVTWNVTRLTTVTGSLTREIEETVLRNSSGYFATRGEIRVDHELLRNLLLNASVGYEGDSFGGISRHDDSILTGVGAKYLIDRNFALSGGYGLRHRSSDVSDATFSEHTAFIRLGSHF